MLAFSKRSYNTPVRINASLRNALSGRDRTSRTKETPLSKIARRKFIQLSAAAAAGCFVADSREAVA
ncbi:MAG: hypothetical protein R3358_08785, partial [Woeseiaceae bacterium]|nr:hypothetical protein [Woeseiaceae bacterium]